jgi:hypothetical protein
MPHRVFLVLLLASGSLAAQISPAPTQPICSVSGQVVQESAGTPLRKVSITLAPSEGSVVFSRQDTREPHSAITDSDGHFQMEGVQPGEYRVILVRSGFLAATRRSRLYSSTLLSLTAGQSLQGLLFRMRPAGVIKGKIVDEDGDAVPGASVMAISASGHGAESNPSATTNDLGEYRIAGLPDGKFAVLAQPQGEVIEMSDKSGAKKIYAPTYYPGTLDRSQATSVEIHSGEEATANFNLSSSRTFTVKGRVFGLNTQPAPTSQRQYVRIGASGTAAITLERADGQDIQPGSGSIQADGTFQIEGVLPGSYNARISSDRGNRLRVSPPIEVRDADLEGLQLTTETAAQVRGRFRMDDGIKLDWRRLQIAIEPDEPRESDGPMGARVQADGSFAFENVQPGNYHVAVTSSSAAFRDYIVKEVNVGGKEVGDSGFSVGSGAAFLDVVGSAKGSTIEGSAVDDDGKPIPDVQIVCIPDAARRKRHEIYQQVQTDQRGYFSLRGLNPGEYQIFALDEQANDVTDPDFVSAHEGQGETVKIEPGERKAIVLKLPTPQD